MPQRNAPHEEDHKRMDVDKEQQDAEAMEEDEEEEMYDDDADEQEMTRRTTSSTAKDDDAYRRALRSILDGFTKEQMGRYEAFRRAGLPKASIKKVLCLSPLHKTSSSLLVVPTKCAWDIRPALNCNHLCWCWKALCWRTHGAGAGRAGREGRVGTPSARASERGSTDIPGESLAKESQENPFLLDVVVCSKRSP